MKSLTQGNEAYTEINIERYKGDVQRIVLCCGYLICFGNRDILEKRHDGQAIFRIKTEILNGF